MLITDGCDWIVVAAFWFGLFLLWPVLFVHLKHEYEVLLEPA